MKKLFAIIWAIAICTSVFSQSEQAYESDENNNVGIFDPSHFSMHHGLSFGMASSGNLSNAKSQSLYTSMMQYKFNAPVTLNLNFGLPIHSTFSSAQNLSSANLRSMDYFKDIPFDASVTWQPTDKMLFHFGVSRYTPSSYYFSDPFDDYSYNSLMRRNYLRTRKTTSDE